MTTATDGIALTFTTPDVVPISLSGRLHLPREGVQAGQWPAAILCHPQPLVSDMDDPLIVACAQALAANGIAALRFNFRGVPPSTGTMTDGRLEPLDIAAAFALLQARPDIDGNRIAIVGHAFGGFVGLVYASIDNRISTVVSISPPWFRLQPDLAMALRQPILIVTGADDEVCPQFKIDPWLHTTTGTHGLVIIPQAQHLMRGFETAATTQVITYMQRWKRA